MATLVARRWQWVVLLLAALPLVVYVGASIATPDAPPAPREPIVLNTGEPSDSASSEVTPTPSGSPSKPVKPPRKSPTEKAPQVVLPSPDDLDDDDDDDGRDDDPDTDTDDD